MISPKQTSEGRGSSHFGHTPLLIIHIIGIFLRIWSVYSMYRNLSQPAALVVLFIFICLVPSSILFLALQKPWKGRPLSNQLVPPSIINGAITALYFILWGKGLMSCGPVRAILAEYSGAVLGVLSATLYGLMHQSIAISGFDLEDINCFLTCSMHVSSSTRDQLLITNKIELPFSAWAFLGTILFGVILIFYVDSIAEERCLY
ncbi:hypothetical protein GH714_032382 [Hevea brasiliensis]|uniref:Uncharacterized protein n=1 Tax=Hevea brasiliensis TaxID=3981 RepID=A0A6A6LDP2_HEVBR|nr:hypothetical protein GH714_032382 [Hevea brasiliensis]